MSNLVVIFLNFYSEGVKRFQPSKTEITFLNMTISEEEAAYYLRFISMYFDLGAEVLLKVFIHHCPGKNAVSFLLSNTSRLQQLKKDKVLNKLESDLVLTSTPNVQEFGASLLTTLSINLFSSQQLRPPMKGWSNPPRNSDKSISADLLRLRTIRNHIIGHTATARLTKWRFEYEWKNVQDIFLRIYRNIAPDEETQLKQRIEEYRLRRLDHSIENKYYSKLREWQPEISEIQQQVEDVFKIAEVLDKYLKSNTDRYERYIELLVKGGRFVMLALVEDNLKAQNKNLGDILKDKEDDVRKIIDDPDHLHCLYPPGQGYRSDRNDMSTWDITLLVSVLLKVLDSSSLDDEAKQAIINIDTARKRYAEAAVVSLDSDAFEEYSYPLKYSIQFLSRYLDNKKKLECEEILSEFKSISESTDTHQTYFDELKKQSIKIKSIQEIYKDQIEKAKHVLQEMTTQGIDFKQKYDVEVQVITVGCDETEKQLGENVLTEIWQEALDRSGYSTAFNEVEKKVSKILKEITEQNMTTHGYDMERKRSEETLLEVREQALERSGDSTDLNVVKKEELQIPKETTDKDWAYFLRYGKKRDVKKLLQTGALPEQRTLDEISRLFGRKSKLTLRICKAICEHIKSKHESIVNVWAAYTEDDPNKITFVVCLQKEESTENKEKGKGLRLHKVIEYSFIKRIEGEYSHESTEIMNNNVTSRTDINDDAYSSLQGCVAKYSVELMKRHQYLSIVSASSKRSTGYGYSWNLKQENCIVLYVHTKHYIPINEEPFKTHYDEIPVDVREGAFIPFGKTATEAMEHVQMGCQICGEFEGTLGCFIDHPQFGLCGLTCAHVVLNPLNLITLKEVHNGSYIWPLHDMCKNVYQPANQTSDIGHTVQLIYKEGSGSRSGMDVALFKLTSRHPISSEFPIASSAVSSTTRNINYEHWRICSAERLNKKMDHVVKFGSKTELRDGMIEFHIISVKDLNCYPLAHGYFNIKLHKQIEVKPKTPGVSFADKGDSGALVFLVGENSSEHTCIGIVEGGTSYGTVVVTPIVPILEELNVSNLKNFDFENTLSEIHGKMENVGSEVQTVKNNVQALTDDMQRMHCDIQTEMQNMESRMDNNMQQIQQRMHRDIQTEMQNMESRMDDNMQQNQRRLHRDIQTEMQNIESRMDNRMQQIQQMLAGLLPPQNTHQNPAPPNP